MELTFKIQFEKGILKNLLEMIDQLKEKYPEATIEVEILY